MAKITESGGAVDPNDVQMRAPAGAEVGEKGEQVGDHMIDRIDFTRDATGAFSGVLVDGNLCETDREIKDALGLLSDDGSLEMLLGQAAEVRVAEATVLMLKFYELEKALNAAVVVPSGRGGTATKEVP